MRINRDRSRDYILAILIIIKLVSCSKEDRQSTIVINTPAARAPWDTCSNLFVKSISIRLGEWRRLDTSGMVNPKGFRFSSDSLVDILEQGNPDTWQRNVKYGIVSCREFKYDIYWIKDRNPAQLYWITVPCEYDSISKILKLSYISQRGLDVILLKKKL